MVRSARDDDRDRVWPLVGDFATSFVPERGAFELAWSRLVVDSHMLVLVAEDAAGGVVGYLLATTHLTFFANGPVVWVEEVMVDQDCRGCGIGRGLMERAEGWTRSIGASYVALATRRAGPFYRALGYEDSAVFFKKTFSV